MIIVIYADDESIETGPTPKTTSISYFDRYEWPKIDDVLWASSRNDQVWRRRDIPWFGSAGMLEKIPKEPAGRSSDSSAVIGRLELRTISLAEAEAYLVLFFRRAF